jgi:hypothetical protein
MQKNTKFVTMKNIYIALVGLVVLPLMGLSQARLVINGTTAVYMVENGGTAGTPIYIDVHNSATTGIVPIGSLGGIISESEFNMVKWDIQTSTGTYTIPFIYDSNHVFYNIPVTFNNTGGAGVEHAAGSGTVKFSTWHTTADNVPRPSDVTNMDPMFAAPGGQPTATDNSWNAVDRFWVVDPGTAATTYSTYPNPALTFSFLNTNPSASPSETMAPNTFPVANLEAQRFNTTAAPHSWSGYLAGTESVLLVNTTGQVATPAAIGTANFFRSWTLANKNNPLPIQLTDFNVNCNNGEAVITWTTQSEINNAYFTIQRSTDGVNYDNVARVNGAGNSTTPINYTATDADPLPGTSYYRLTQTDYDGNTNEFSPIAFTGCQISGVTIGAFRSMSNNYITVRINAPEADNYDISLVSTLGQVVINKTKGLPSGYNEFTLDPGKLTWGVYLLNIHSNNSVYTKKLILGAQ